MERLNLIKQKEKNTVYSRATAEKVLENILKRINEVNTNKEFIYKITKAVVFGSYINSNKEKLGDLDIALYIKLKDSTKSEYMQNYTQSKKSNKYVPFLLESIYGKEEVFKFIKNRKRVLQLHDGVKAEADAKYHNEPKCYIYVDEYNIIYEEK